MSFLDELFKVPYKGNWMHIDGKWYHRSDPKQPWVCDWREPE